MLVRLRRLTSGHFRAHGMCRARSLSERQLFCYSCLHETRVPRVWDCNSPGGSIGCKLGG